VCRGLCFSGENFEPLLRGRLESFVPYNIWVEEMLSRCENTRSDVICESTNFDDMIHSIRGKSKLKFVFQDFLNSVSEKKHEG
jgi:hypothetical protein